MADNTLARRRLIGRITFCALSVVIIYSHLIPLETVPPSMGGVTLTAIDPDEVLHDPVRWIAPDFLILVTLAWVTRRPSFAPVLAIGAVFILADLLFHRPPGLWTALVLIASEMLRRRARSMRTLPFWLEWATVSVAIATITALYAITLSLVAVPQASLGLTLVQLVATLVFYPVVVFVSYAVFGVSRPAPGQVDALGHRI